MPPRHRGQHLISHFLQQRGIAPGRVGHNVMQRLVHLAHVARSQTRGHGLDALALQGQQKTLRVVLQGNNAIGMPDGSGQTIQIALQALRLTRKIRLATLHRPQRTALPSPPPGKSKLRYSLYNTVVVEAVEIGVDGACLLGSWCERPVRSVRNRVLVSVHAGLRAPGRAIPGPRAWFRHTAP